MVVVKSFLNFSRYHILPHAPTYYRSPPTYTNSRAPASFELPFTLINVITMALSPHLNLSLNVSDKIYIRHLASLVISGKLAGSYLFG